MKKDKLDIKTGLIGHDKKRATPGYTLFAPIRGDTARLIGMDGETVHQWRLEAGGINYCVLLGGGNLFVYETAEGGPPLIQGKAGLIREYDWDGNLVWEHRDDHGHHDARRLDTGNTLYLAWEKLSAGDAARVGGGRQGSEDENGDIWGDCLREVDSAGNLVWQWQAKDLAIEDHEICPLCPRDEFAHANTCCPLPGGDILISFRTLNTIMIIERATKRVRWKMRDHRFGHQHDCQMLDSGNILLFANGYHSHDQSHSRIVEIDPGTKETVWQYRAQPPQSFFSPHVSGCQRLASGNTLICEGAKGRVFEVTPAGDTVWDYVSPHTVENPIYGTVNWIFRARRYAAGGPELAGRL